MKVYRSAWQYPGEREKADTLRVSVLEPTWDLASGWHPDMDLGAAFHDVAIRQPFAVKKAGHLPSLVEIQPQGAVTGHVMLKDGNGVSLTQPDDRVPIAPLFMRDLAGRVVYMGIAKNKKDPDAPSYALPEGSVLVPEDMGGYHLLERVYFCPFRFIEMSDKAGGELSGNIGTQAVVTYQAPNLYPYKLRLDTFYQDGWRIPQTEQLFVVPGVDKSTSEKATADLLNLWYKRPKDQPYETFYEANEAQFEGFFKAGCTLIPTLEGFNGCNKVGADFEHLDFWPGKAVAGLHDVVAQKDSDAPAGTILEVLEPGYVTQADVTLARVVVSNGKAYKSPNNPDGAHQRAYPDLRFPHQRTSGKWGAVWVPTKPADFEEPAIWGWEDASKGRFVQLRGPLWDPLHYYYACTPLVIDAFERNRTKRNINLVTVPEEALGRFYPVVDIRGFDSFNMPLKKQRQEALSLLPTAIFWHEDIAAVTHVGYHPLPLHYEFELDNWWFPDLAPKYRVSPSVPIHVEKGLVPVVQPKISPDKFIATVVGDKENCPWVNDPLYMAICQSDETENYPYLKCYIGASGVPDAELKGLVFPYLADIEFDELLLQDLSVDVIRTLEENWPGVYQMLLAATRKAEEAVRFRHGLFRSNYDKYIRSLWEMTQTQELFQHVEEAKDPKLKLPAAALQGIEI